MCERFSTPSTGTHLLFPRNTKKYETTFNFYRCHFMLMFKTLYRISNGGYWFTVWYGAEKRIVSCMTHCLLWTLSCNMFSSPRGNAQRKTIFPGNTSFLHDVPSEKEVVKCKSRIDETVKIGELPLGLLPVIYECSKNWEWCGAEILVHAVEH
jgi:hypothetical protein